MRQIATILALAVAAMAFAQHSFIAVTTPSGTEVTVEEISPNVLKISNVPTTAPANVASEIVEIPGSESAKISTSAGEISLRTPGGVVATLEDAGRLTIDAGKGKILVDPGTRTDGIRLYTSGSGAFYGAGERGHKLNLRGDTLTMFNRQNYGYTGSDRRINQMNITMPLLVSTDGYGLVFDDYAKSQLIAGNPIVFTTSSPQPVSYYFVNGATDVADVVEAMTSVTGRQPLPPLWALGYITSRYGYRTQDETIGTIDTLQQLGYPVDGIVLDLYWYGKEEDMGRLAWDPEQWPDPEGMLRNLKDRNVNTVLISQPYVLRNGRGVDNYNELASKGMLVKDREGRPLEVKIWVGEGGMLDVANPDTRRWLANRYRQLTDMGVGGWWGDLGEPEVHPDSAVHATGEPMHIYHNRYGNDWSKIISDLYAEQYPDRRLLTMMRGGTTGLQQYSVFPWSTDVSRSWGGLEPQIRIMLNSGLSGLGYMGHDVGGFAVDKGHEYQPELYVRWLQLGLFSPMLRTHAQEFAEPYRYPEFEEIILSTIMERYRWLPYNYTLAWENATKGYPLVRPLNFHDSGAPADCDDEFLWGDNVLVAPVLTSGATSRSVVLPEGTWYDFPTHFVRSHKGGRTITVDAPIDQIPVFARGGSFIPMADYEMSSTADYDPAQFTLYYFPEAGETTHYTLYDDNRMSPTSLADGQYRLLNFEGTASDGSYHVTISSDGSYEGAPDAIDIRLIVVTESSSDYKSTHSQGLKLTEGTQRGAQGWVEANVHYVPGSVGSIDIKF